MSNESSINVTDRINKYLFSALLFISILFGGDTKELFEFPKTTALYIIGGSIIVLFLLERLGHKIRIAVPNTFVTLFLLVNIIATIFSTHRYTSFWGYYSRFNGGLLSTLILFSIYIVVSSNKEFYKKTLTEIPIISILPISIYAIFQHFSGIERAYSTLGQPNWLAAYIVMLIPLITEKFIRGNKKMLVFYILAFSSLWFTYSLSGTLGFLVAVSAVYLRVRPFPKKAFAIIFFITVSIAITNPGIFQQKVSDLWLDIKNQLTLVRVANASQEHTLSDPGFIRFSVWKGTLDLIMSSPKILLIGVGPQTFPYEFQKFRPGELNYSSEWDFIINKPHNYYLELGSELGIAGLLIYLLILWKTRKGTFFPSIAGYAVTNLFGWPVVPTAILFWAMLAYSFEARKTSEIKLPKITGWLLIPIISFSMYKALSYYSADAAFVNSMDRFRENKLDLSLRYISEAMQKNPNEPNYPKQKARIYTAMSAGSAESKKKALENLKKAYDLNPKNLATKRDIIPLYFFLAIKDIKHTSDSDNMDKEYFPIAVEYLKNLKLEYPTDAGTLADIARYEKRLDQQGYEITKRMVEKLRPDLLTWHESFR